MKLKLSGILFAVATLVVSQAVARPVTRDEARAAARAFTARGKVLGARLGTRVEKIDELATTDGAAFFAVKMSGGGTVITAGDTELEPVVAILPSDVDITTIDKASPLWALLNRDLSERQKALRKGWQSEVSRRRWSRLVTRTAQPALAPVPAAAIENQAEITDIRVEPLVSARWNQKGGGEDYYTPKNYYSGCVATAMAQIMHYFRWPQAEIEPFDGECAVAGNAQKMTAKGGTYDWANMPNAGGTDETTREAIGHLMYDCGVAVRMSWGEDGSGAFTEDVAEALVAKFKYANAKCVSTNPKPLLANDSFYGTYIYSSLDALSPVELGINSSTQYGIGHAIVGDGYGFVDDVSYVHLNMGWGGKDNAWYHLPEMRTKATASGNYYDYDQILTIVYNIFPEATGSVLSGRVTDEEGTPLENAEVEISQNGTVVTNVLSSATGVWAAILPEGTYDVTAVSADGELKGDIEAVGLRDTNRWGNEVTLTSPSVRVGEKTYSSLNYALRQATTGDVVEVFGPTVLKRSVNLGFNCTVYASGDAVSNGVRVVNNSAITLQTGAKLALTNLCFVGQSDKPLISVETNATLSVAGLVDLGTIKVSDITSLDVAGEISRSIYVMTPSNKVNNVFATYSCAPETAAACANHLVNPEDDELGGVATADGFFAWAYDAPVPDDVAAVRLEVPGSQTNFRTLAALMRHFPDSGDVGLRLIRDSKLELSSELELVNRTVTVTSEGLPARTLTIVQNETCASRFVCQEEGELVFENVTVKGSDVSDYLKSQSELVRVEGGLFKMLAGAAIEDHITTDPCKYGAIALLAGEVTLKDGARIANCTASSSNTGRGGAVSVHGGTLHLFGATITNCTANTTYGQSLYVHNEHGESKVELSGKVVVDTPAYVFSRDLTITPFEVVGPLEAGSMLPIDHLMKLADHSKDALSEGKLIATVADGVTFSDAETEATRRAFINTKNGELGAEFNGQTLVWGEKLPPEPGLVRVIQGEATNEFMTAEEAFASITTNATVMLLADVGHDEPLTVAHTVTLTSGVGGPFELYGTGSLEVKGGALTLTDVRVAGPKYIDFFGDLLTDIADQPMIYVEDGSLTLGAGACVNAYMGVPTAAEPRNDLSAIVLKGSTFTMLEGSVIEDCYNLHYDAVKGDFYDGVKGDSGCGAAVYAYSESKVNLLGGKIANCWAEYGAVFLQQGSEGYVEGNFTLKDNTTLQYLIDEDGYLVVDEDYFPVLLDWHDSDLVVDESSTIEIRSPLTGSVGRDYAVTRHNSDTNYVAQIADWRTWDSAALTNSVASFFHDVDPTMCAAIVTNETDTALVVWATAVRDGAYTKDGVTYELMCEVKPDPVTPGPGPGPGPGPDPETATPEPIAFTKIAMNADRTEVTLAFTNAVQWCNYAIFGAPSLQAGFGADPVTNFQWQVTEPKVELTLPTNGNLFWKATAAEGQIP